MAKRWLLLLLCLVALPLLFAGLCHRGFTDNEGMYAEAARAILVSGDWLTPHINGAVYLNKPPLLFWLAALVLRVTGLSELPRLISGLAALATMLLVADMGRRIWPQHRAAGVWAAAVYLSSALTPIEAIPFPIPSGSPGPPSPGGWRHGCCCCPLPSPGSFTRRAGSAASWHGCR